MLLSLLLYGSRARGDHRLRSDVDLLGIVENGAIGKEVAARGSSFYHYPLPSLIKGATNGDLFVSHLVHEAKVLHDTVDIFKRVQASFRWRDSYRDERRNSKIIIRFITDRPDSLTKPAVRKRLVWAIRTLIISTAAEQKIPIFGSKDLSSFVSMPYLKGVIEMRNTIEVDDLIAAAKAVSDSLGSETRLMWPIRKHAQAAYMFRAGGILASTAQMIEPRLMIDETEARQIDYPI